MYMKITPSMTTNHELVEDAMVKVSDSWSRLSRLLLFTVWFLVALSAVYDRFTTPIEAPFIYIRPILLSWAYQVR